MHKQTWSRMISLMLVLALCLGLFPVSVLGAETAFEKVPSLEAVTSGSYILLNESGYAPGALENGWLLGNPLTAQNDQITGAPAGTVWHLTVEGTQVHLTDANGIEVGPKGPNKNGIAEKAYAWNLTFQDGFFQFHSQEADAVTLACNLDPANGQNRFRAYKNTTIAGNPATYPVNFTLYKADGEVLPPDPITPPGPTDPVTPDPVELPVKTGDKVVIFNPANGMALSQTYGTYNNNGTPVTLENGELKGYTETDIWTVTVNEDGSVQFATADGKKLSMGEKFTSMPLDDMYADWKLTKVSAEPKALTADLYRIENVGRKAFMEWFADKNYWSAYYKVDPAQEALFNQQLYVVESAPVDPEPGDPVVPSLPFQSGDKVVIYNPANLKALSSVYNGFYNTAVDVTLDGETVTGYTDAEIWTVTVNPDGSVQFATADGKKLSMGAEHGSMPLDDVNPDWNILNAATADCYYIQNTVRQQYVNWSEKYGTFSAYKTVNAEGNFAMKFFLVQEETPDPVDPSLPVKTGDKVVIYNPANLKALSSVYNGFYNTGVDVTLDGEALKGFTNAEVWTVTVNADGSVQFATQDGQKLSMGEKFSSMPLDDVNPDWTVTPAATEGCYYIQNAVRKSYLEWYAQKGNWSSFGKIGDEALFAQKLYIVTGDIPVDPKPQPVDEYVMLYNEAAKGVLAHQDANVESPSIKGTDATLAENKILGGNGGVLFHVEQNGEYLRFYNETYGYLCSNGTGNNAFYAKEAGTEADWLPEARGVGYTLKSREAKFQGKYPQYLEYYGGSYKTYSMNKVKDYDIFTFRMLPSANPAEQMTGGIVNLPQVRTGNLAPAFVGMAYDLSFTVEAVFGVQEVKATVGGQELALTLENGGYALTIPVEKVKGTELSVVVSGTDTKGVAFSHTIVIPVQDEPVISEPTPAPGTATNEDHRPVISAKIVNAGENPTVSMELNTEAVEAKYENGLISYQAAQDMAEGRVTVKITVTRADGKSAVKSWNFTVGQSREQLYFGQLHSHTTYSDGSGSLETALDYVYNLPESANVDFVAFTDHSNYFDTTSNPNPEQSLYDMSLAGAESQKIWDSYKKTVADFNAKQTDMIALAGFEMTWSGGPGHINTFVTPGIVSRNNKTLNNKTADAGLKAYYALLCQPEGVDTVNQFNHPGTTFGNFNDFAHWDALIDTRMQLVEVGNGEGAIGAGGYYPSYEQYIMALDKGWHVAPSNNQDNHKGRWGNANDARDVILTDDFSENGIYEAIRQRKVYATEDKNLEILYTVNGLPLGSVISEVPETLNIEAQVYDPDAADSLRKVELVVNSGKVAYTWEGEALESGLFTCTLDPTYSYYFLRVTQADGDIAVTAPVWVGETLKLGISSVDCSVSTPVTGEELELKTTLFNSEATAAKVTSVTYLTEGSKVLATDNTGYTVPASGNASIVWKYTPEQAKVMRITVRVVMELNGESYTFSMDTELDIQRAEDMVYVGIDAAHHNEYVAGNYKDSMGNFGKLAAAHSVRTVELPTSEALIAACKNEKYQMLILTVPSRRDGDAIRDPYENYTDDEIAAIVEFNRNGGTVILAGWSDYYEHYSAFPQADHMAAQQNRILTALGSSLRIGDDATNDDTFNGGQKQRLYFNTYNMDSFLMEGVEFDAEHPHDNLYSQQFSQYGGASIYAVDAQGQPTSVLPATVTPVVYGHATTYSTDSDQDGLGGETMPKYPVAEGDDRLLVLGTEQLPDQGLIIVSGAAFMSNFEVQAKIEDSNAEKNYSNYNICENLMDYVNPVKLTPIAEVQKQTEKGYKYTISGVVTSNASGFDKDTAFFDCIYVQDETAGVCCFPVAGEYQVGDIVQITGTTDFYQGEMELQVTTIEKLGYTDPVVPMDATAAQVNSGEVLGSLVRVTGTVDHFELANGLIQSIYVKDAKGETVRLFIDGYITTAEDVKDLTNGCKITAVGLASYDNTFNAPEGPFPRVRIRDRADIVCTASDDVNALVAAAEAAKKAAEEAQAAAEAAQQKAEAAQAAAEEAAASTAADKAAAEAAAQKAEAAKAEAEAAKAAAEAAQTAAENAAKAAEASNLAAAEEARKAAEEAAKAAQDAAAAAEAAEKAANAQAAAQSAQQAAEEAAAVAEQARKDAEAAKAAAEEAAKSTATDKEAAEKAAQEAAEAQKAAEDAMKAAEDAKNAAEASKEAAEASNEAAAAAAEEAAKAAKEAAEYFRQISEMKAEMAQYLEDAQKAKEAAEEAQKAAEAAELACAKYYALFVLADYADEDDYLEAQQAELAAAMEAGVEAIQAAETVAAVEEALANAQAIIDEIPTAEELVLPYTDVKDTDWFVDAVRFVTHNGLMNGMTATTFGPNVTMDRAMLVTVLYRMEQEPAVTGDMTFTDVDAEDYYYNAVLWAAQNGIVNGITEEIFAPRQEITRQQMVTMLYRFAEYRSLDVTVSGDLSAFADADTVDAYAVEPMIWATENGLIRGMGENYLQPRTNSTRAQVATVLMRFAK